MNMKKLLALACMALVFFTAETSSAADRWWDGGTTNIAANGDGASQGGSGTWNTSTNNWDQGGAQPHIAWGNGSDTAIFGGTAGTVTLGEGITVGGLVFNTASYVVTANTLTFGAAGIISNAVAATISSAIAGTGPITKDGAGTLTLSGTSSYTGGTVLNAGGLATTADSNLGNTSGGITVNGTVTWSIGTTGSTYARNLVVSNGAVLTFSAASAGPRSVTGVLSGNGTIGVSSSDPITFSNTGNTFSGIVNCGYAMSFGNLGDSSNPINLGGGNGVTWTGSAKTFALRPFTASAAGSYAINNSGTGALVIQQPLTIAGAAGARTLSLAGSYAGISTFAGDITNGTGSVVSLSKPAGAATWALSGTNTYTGATTIIQDNSANARALVFQGLQALPSGTALYTSTTSGNGGPIPGVFKLLDDSASPASRTGVNLFLTVGNSGTDSMTLFVGNNGVANGGNGAGGTTGSTIQMGSMNFTNSTTSGNLAVTGANGYKLQINNVNIALPSRFRATSSTPRTERRGR
jgi:fibronectin-binding autotransporter adhesin